MVCRQADFLASRFASVLALLYSAGPANKPVLQAILRISCMVAFLTDVRFVFRSSLGNQQIHFDCCEFQSDIKVARSDF